MNLTTSDNSAFVTHAGAYEKIPSIGHHDHVPHVYIVWWPAYCILKVGLSTTSRWARWERTGAVEIAMIEPCCEVDMRETERHLLDVLADCANPAFSSYEESRWLLNSGGWSECFTLPRSPRYGTELCDDIDYESAYGLALPMPLVDAMRQYQLRWKQVL